MEESRFRKITLILLSWSVNNKNRKKQKKKTKQNQLLCSSKVVKKLAVKLNASLNVPSAHLILIHNFYIGLIERLEGVT